MAAATAVHMDACVEDVEMAAAGAGAKEDSSTCADPSEGSLSSSKASTASLSKELKRSTSSFRKGGTFPTAICLAKAAIGAGVLSISAHSADVGFGFMFACLAVGGVLTQIGIRLIAEASIAIQRWSFEDLCEELFYTPMAVWTGLINTCNCLGAAAGYLIVCGQVFAVLTDATETARKAFVLAVGIFVCAPLALAPHVSFMRHLALLSCLAILLLVFTVLVYLGDNGVDETIDVDTFWSGSGGANVFTYMNTMNIVIFAYNNQFNVPQLTSELTPKPEIRRMARVSLISTSLCFFMYASVTVVGTLAFGVGDNQQDTLVMDLYPDRHNPLVIVTLLAVMFSVVTCFQFHIYPIRQFLSYAARKVRGRAADDCEDRMVYGLPLTRWLDIICALLAVVVAIVIAVFVSTIKVLLDFIGAFAGAWVSYVIPPLFIIQIRRRKEGFSWMNSEILLCLAFFSLGAFLFVFGTYSAIHG